MIYQDRLLWWTPTDNWSNDCFGRFFADGEFAIFGLPVLSAETALRNPKQYVNSKLHSPLVSQLRAELE